MEDETGDKKQVLERMAKRIEQDGGAADDDGAVRDDRAAAAKGAEGGRKTSPDLGHGTPGGSLGSLNESDLRDPEVTAEKSGEEA